MLDQDHKDRIKRILLLSKPYKRAFENWRTKLKGPHEALNFAYGQAVGQHLEPICDVVRALFDGGLLTELGLRLAEKKVETQVVSDGRMYEEDLNASGCGRLVVAFVRARVRSQCNNIWGWPLRLAAVAAGMREVAQHTIDQLRMHYEHFIHVADSVFGRSAQYKKRFARSPLNWPIMRSFIAKCMRAVWRCNDLLVTTARDLFFGIGNSAIIEDAAQKMRADEPENKRITLLHVWSIPVKYKCLSQLNFDERDRT